MEEIEGDLFKEFPYKTLNKQEAKVKQDPKTLKKVYKHMIAQMDLWFTQNGDRTGRDFKPEMIDLKKLVDA